MKRGKVNPEIFFYIISLTGIVIMFAMLIFSKGKAMSLMVYGESLSCDFWRHINRLLEYESLYGNVNDADAIFPPLAYCFLQLFAQCLRHFDSSVELAVTGFGILVFNMYLLIFMTAFTIVLRHGYQSNSKCLQSILPFIFLFSYPFWGFAFERGNPVIYAMLFLFIGVMERNHPNKAVREAALISVAIAAGFKIYPALFGLLWVREKRYKEAFRLLIYGMIAFFVPFCFFGGIGGVSEYIGTFTRYMGKDVCSETSILGNCIILFGEQGKNIGKVLLIVWGIWVIYYLFAEGVTWKSITLLISTHTIMIAESYVYTFVYIAIPCVCFLNYMNMQKSYRKIDYVYAAMFAAIFTLPPVVLKRSGVLHGMYACWIGVLAVISIEKMVKLSKDFYWSRRSGVR